MATANVRNIVKLSGRLCYGPTDLSTAFPHGGTALGLIRNIVFRPNQKNRPIKAEEWGNQTTEVIYGGDSCTLGVVLREFDDEALSAMFLDTAAGTSSATRVVSGRANRKRAGVKLSTKAVKLFFSPRATERHRGLLIYKAVPVVEETAELRFSMGEEVGTAAVWHGVPDSSNRVYAFGLLEDLTL